MFRFIAMAAWIPVFLWLATACDGDPPGIDGADADTDADTDADSDADSDADADADADADSDPEDEEPCTPAYAMPCATFPYEGCLEGDFVVASQADAALLAGWPCVTGTVVVTIPDLTEIALPDLVAACNLMVLDNTTLASIGLDSLAEVPGQLCLARNEALAEVGAPLLDSAGSGLFAWENAALEDFSGLSGLAAVAGLSIRGNEILNSLDGLQQIAEAGAVEIVGNPSLASLAGLDGLIEVTRSLWIIDNPALESLAGLGNLETVVPTEGYPVAQLHIGGNGVLTSLSAASSLQRVDHLAIWGNGALSDVAFPALIGVGDLQISNNAALADLDGLGGLTALGAHVAIFDNASLADLDGLGGVTDLEDGGTWVVVQENPGLPTCAAQGFVDQLEGFTGETCIWGNLADSCPDNVTSDDCTSYL